MARKEIIYARLSHRRNYALYAAFINQVHSSQNIWIFWRCHLFNHWEYQNVAWRFFAITNCSLKILRSNTSQCDNASIHLPLSGKADEAWKVGGARQTNAVACPWQCCRRVAGAEHWTAETPPGQDQMKRGRGKKQLQIVCFLFVLFCFYK